MVVVEYVVSAVVLLGLCIFIHELGHLIGGRLVGIKAEVFSIGYGKGVLKKKFGDTTYQLTLIPFGGYCKFYGEDPSDERKGESYEFLSAHPLKRIVVVIMGPLFNLFFGIVLFFMMNMVGYPVPTNKVLIPEYLKSGKHISPAYRADKKPGEGILTGDRVIEIDGNSIHGFPDLQSRVLFSEGKPLSIKVEREVNGTKKILEFTVTPERLEEKGHYLIGLMPYGDRILVVSTVPGEPAEKAGLEQFDEIISINGTRMKDEEKFIEYVRASANKKLSMRINRRGKEVTVAVVPREKEVLVMKGFEHSGFEGESQDLMISAPDRLALIKKAIQAKTVRINDVTVDSFESFKRIVAAGRGKRIKLENAGGTYYGTIEYEKFGFIGVDPSIAPDLVTRSFGVVDSLGNSLSEPVDFIVMNLKGIGMLFTGQLSVRENLSGPIRIMKIAGDTAHYRGVSAFIILMAKISIILMVMNLLPIPVVDGSYILFFLFEAIRGKPINQKLMERINLVGITLLIMLGIFVIFNDLSVMPFIQKLFN